MSSYLFVTLFGGGSLGEVKPTKDGILSKALFDFKLHFLHAAFLF